MRKYTSARIWLSTVKNLRMIYAITGESMIKIMDRLVEEELRKVEIDSEKPMEVE